MSLDKTAASGGDVLAMSDDEIMNMSAPPEVGEDTGSKDLVEDENKAPEPKLEDKPAEGESDESKVEEQKTEDENKDTAGEGGDTETGTEAKPGAKAQGEDQSKAPAEAKDKGEKEASSPGSNEGTAEPTSDQALAFYKQVMTPFKANGKMIQLKDPSEVIQLMQMGANYTRKLQDIQPHRKVLLMLQNNDLLDEGKLSYLIDLDKKNPEAIKKLIKDAGIDPMDIDTNVEPAYHEGNHRVSDEEATFRQTLDELTSSEAGKETLQFINTDWDQASKEALWQSPQIMSVIHQQRENGVYDLITTEMERQRLLGQIPPGTPFLEAYKIVGDELAKAGTFGNPGTEQKEPVVVATTTAAPKPAVTNGDKANAASPTRTTTRKAEKLVNPLAMSDEEILKLDRFDGRI